ncbi:MAG: hypothetical protein Q8R92_21185 [Deltaproteobacteria bacterium]|nr:hypothetical protein [Deltaproteobacteria bacterium]
MYERGYDDALRQHEERDRIPCDECGGAWRIVGGVTEDGVGWVEGTAAHECDGVGVLATFKRAASGSLAVTHTICFEDCEPASALECDGPTQASTMHLSIPADYALERLERMQARVQVLERLSLRHDEAEHRLLATTLELRRLVAELAKDLGAVLADLVRRGMLARPSKCGDRYRRYQVPALRCPLDLFLCRPPAQWGLLLAIRTGPADFSRELMRAAARQRLRVFDCALHGQAGNVLLTPTEQDVFAALGWNDVPPEMRRGD